MLGEITGIFTTAKPIGVAVRDLAVALGSIIAIFGVLGLLTPEQVKALTAEIDKISGQLPALLLALGTIMAAGTSIYRTLFKSSSDKAAEAAKQIDAVVPADKPVEIVTPGAAPNILIAP